MERYVIWYTSIDDRFQDSLRHGGVYKTKKEALKKLSKRNYKWNKELECYTTEENDINYERKVKGLIVEKIVVKAPQAYIEKVEMVGE